MQEIDPRLQELSYRARDAMVAGRHDEAARLWMQILAVAPNHLQALIHLGQFMLQRNDAKGARELFERAAAVAPRDAMPALHLALVARALNDDAGEAAALERALSADPYCFPALLLKGVLLERLGKKRQAARIFKDALTIVPPDEQLSPDLRAQVTHARKSVQNNIAAMQEFLESNLSRARAKHPDANLSRFEQCREAVLGVKKIYTQQPAIFHFPGLPAIQFYDNMDFPWITELESKTEEIREEFLRVYREDNASFAPYVDHPQGVPINQWAELNRSPRWSALHLWRDGERFDDVCRRCPKTVSAVDAVPKIEIPDFGPTVLFSALAPHTRIPAHTSSTNIRLIVHLPLIVPPGCGFRVGNETREWQVGKAWIFDDTIEHEAWNDSGELRVILMIDIWNPYLTAPERDLAGALLNSIRQYYK